MNQAPVTVTYFLEEVLGKINDKLDNMQKDVNDLKIGQARLEEEVKSIKEHLKELKCSSKAQIWTLIGILITAVGGFLVAVRRFVISGNP